jgi:hypothetical protein
MTPTPMTPAAAAAAALATGLARDRNEERRP